jgi:hypothetical protein
MRINKKILNIPPYISTPWKNIRSLTAKEHNGQHSLLVTLLDGSITQIPDLDKVIIEAIFAEHANYFDEQSKQNQIDSYDDLTELSLPFFAKMSIPGLEGISSILQHNVESRNCPDLPEDLLNKLSSITYRLEQEELDAIPKPEPHCNCPHCQITRAIYKNACAEDTSPIIDEDEIVSEKDLQFKTWDIKQTSDHIYEVRNPLDSEEYYHVHLNDPIGCTCGHNDCEHIQAVLKS